MMAGRLEVEDGDGLNNEKRRHSKELRAGFFKRNDAACGNRDEEEAAAGAGGRDENSNY